MPSPSAREGRESRRRCPSRGGLSDEVRAQTTEHGGAELPRRGRWLIPRGDDVPEAPPSVQRRERRKRETSRCNALEEAEDDAVVGPMPVPGAELRMRPWATPRRYVVARECVDEERGRHRRRCRRQSRNGVRESDETRPRR